jgi:hypothetical protein
MFIYVNGDSNAAGFELSHPSLPSYPGHIPPGVITRTNFLSLDSLFAKAAGWLESEIFQKEKREAGEDVVKQRDLELAWPSKLKKHLDCDIQVNAVPGSSTVRVALTTQMDLLKLRNQNKIPDLVILQITDWIRTGTFDLEDSELCQNINSSPNCDLPRRNFFKAWFEIEDEQDMILRYLHHWVMIKHSVKANTGRYPMFIDSTYELHIKDLLEKATHPLHLELIEELGWRDFDRSMSMSYYHNTEQDYLHPGLHLSEPVHDRFAKAVATKLSTMFNVPLLPSNDM